MTPKSEKLGKIIKEIIDCNGTEIFSEPGAKRFYSILTDEAKNTFDLSPVKVMCESGMIQTIAEYKNFSIQERRDRLNEVKNRLVNKYNLGENLCNEWIDAFGYALGILNNGVPDGEVGFDSKEKSSEEIPQNIPVDDFVLGSMENGFVIRKYKGSCAFVVIPDVIRDHQVIGIGASAFEGNATLEIVSIPLGIQIIGKRAFRNCRMLKKVECYNGTVNTHAKVIYQCEINKSAFDGDTTLEEVWLPSNVTTIGENAFRNCKMLKKVGCYNGTADTYVKVTSKCKIAKSAFDGNKSLEEVWIPSPVRAIGENAFRNCTNLRMVYAHKNITVIGKCAFQGCISMQHMDFGCGVPAEEKIVIFSPKTRVIGMNAFCTTTWKAVEKEYVVKEATVHGIGNFSRAFSHGIPIFKHPFHKSLFYNPGMLLLYIIIYILLITVLIIAINN